MPCCAHRCRSVGVAPGSLLAPLLGRFRAVNHQTWPPRRQGSTDSGSPPPVSMSPPPCVLPLSRSELLTGPARPHPGCCRRCGPRQAGHHARPGHRRLAAPSVHHLVRPGHPHANVHKGNCSLVALVLGAFAPCCLGRWGSVDPPPPFNGSGTSKSTLIQLPLPSLRFVALSHRLAPLGSYQMFLHMCSMMRSARCLR
jgi:hypothetical protein